MGNMHDSLLMVQAGWPGNKSVTLAMHFVDTGACIAASAYEDMHHASFGYCAATHSDSHFHASAPAAVTGQSKWTIPDSNTSHATSHGVETQAVPCGNILPGHIARLDTNGV